MYKTTNNVAKRNFMVIEELARGVQKLNTSIVVVAIDACTKFGTALVGGVEGGAVLFHVRRATW